MREDDIIRWSKQIADDMIGLQRRINELSEERRLFLIELREIHCWSYRRIGKELGLSGPRIKQIIDK